MAIARVQISTAIIGHEAEYMAATSEGAKLMQSKGLKNFLRVSHSGTPGIEVWSMTMFDDWEEYGAAQDKLNGEEFFSNHRDFLDAIDWKGFTLMRILETTWE